MGNWLHASLQQANRVESIPADVTAHRQYGEQASYYLRNNPANESLNGDAEAAGSIPAQSRRLFGGSVITRFAERSTRTEGVELEAASNHQH